MKENAILLKEKSPKTASIGIRFWNYTLDFIFINIFRVLSGEGLNILQNMEIASAKKAYIISVICIYNLPAALLWILLYYIISEGFWHITIGKKITGSKVVMMDGSPLTFDAAVSRSFFRFVPFEAFSILASDSRMWHDKWAKTVVIKNRACLGYHKHSCVNTRQEK